MPVPFAHVNLVSRLLFFRARTVLKKSLNFRGSPTLCTRGFSRARRKFSVSAEGRHIFVRRPKPETALEKSLAPRVGKSMKSPLIFFNFECSSLKSVLIAFWLSKTEYKSQRRELKGDLDKAFFLFYAITNYQFETSVQKNVEKLVDKTVQAFKPCQDGLRMCICVQSVKLLSWQVVLKIKCGP